MFRRVLLPVLAICAAAIAAVAYTTSMRAEVRLTIPAPIVAHASLDEIRPQVHEWTRAVIESAIDSAQSAGEERPDKYLPAAIAGAGDLGALTLTAAHSAVNAVYDNGRDRYEFCTTWQRNLSTERQYVLVFSDTACTGA